MSVLPSVIEVIVHNKRMDILREGDIIKLLDNKWEAYAEKISGQRFYDSIIFSALIFWISFSWLPGSKDEMWEEQDYWADVGRICHLASLHVCEVLVPFFALKHVMDEPTRIWSEGRFQELLFAWLTVTTTGLVIFGRWTRCTCGPSASSWAPILCDETQSWPQSNMSRLLLNCMLLLLLICILRRFILKPPWAPQLWCKGSKRCWWVWRSLRKEASEAAADDKKSADTNRGRLKIGFGFVVVLLVFVLVDSREGARHLPALARQWMPMCYRVNSTSVWENLLNFVQTVLTFHYLYITLMGQKEYG